MTPAGGVLQVRRGRRVFEPNTRGTLGVQIQRIDLDDRRDGTCARPADVLGDRFSDRGRRQDHRGRCVFENGTHTFVVRADLRHCQRNRDASGLHRAQESQDVLEPLRSQDHGSFPGRAMPLDLVRNVKRSLVQLRPGHDFSDARPILLVVGERESRIVGL